MYKQWLGGILFVLLAGILVPKQAQATVMIYMDTKELTKRAQVVVRGTVVQQQVVEIQGHLWTDSYVRVDEGLKGGLGSRQTMIVRQPGGDTVVVGERVSGAARFSVGEEVLVLARPVSHFFVPVGMCLGKYRIVRNVGVAPLAERDLEGASLATFALNGRFTMLHQHSRQQRPLAELVQSIRLQIRRTKKGGGR